MGGPKQLPHEDMMLMLNLCRGMCHGYACTCCYRRAWVVTDWDKPISLLPPGGGVLKGEEDPIF